MSKINLLQVNEWYDQAKDILEKSNEICSLANRRSNTAIREINKILASNRYQFLIDSVSQQLRLLDIIRNSSEQLIKTINSEFELELNHKSIETLEIALGQLQDIKTTKDKTLMDFINTDEIMTMKLKFQSLREKIMNDKLQLDISPLSEQLSIFQKELSVILDKNSVQLITTELDPAILENNGLEQDMALLLEGLTKHYDQTSKSMDYFKDTNVSSNTKLELFEVLKNDSLELPGVMQELQEINQQFCQNCDKISDTLDRFQNDESNLIEFFGKVKSFGNELQNEIIQEFNNRYNQIIDNLFPFIDLNKDLIDLAKYYHNFIKSFENLKIELRRRSQVNAHLQKIVRDFKDTFLETELQDRLIREKFLNENGEYLPRNILDDDNEQKSNILYNLLPAMEVFFETESIPKL